MVLLMLLVWVAMLLAMLLLVVMRLLLLLLLFLICRVPMDGALASPDVSPARCPHVCHACYLHVVSTGGGRRHANRGVHVGARRRVLCDGTTWWRAVRLVAARTVGRESQPPPARVLTCVRVCVTRQVMLRSAANIRFYPRFFLLMYLIFHLYYYGDFYGFYLWGAWLGVPAMPGVWFPVCRCRAATWCS